jgi:hypothetical protein
MMHSTVPVIFRLAKCDIGTGTVPYQSLISYLRSNTWYLYYYCITLSKKRRRFKIQGTQEREAKRETARQIYKLGKGQAKTGPYMSLDKVEDRDREGDKRDAKTKAERDKGRERQKQRGPRLHRQRPKRLT